MSKFNKIPDIGKELYEREDAVLNYEGALAFKLDPLAELYLRAASSLVGEPKFYTDEVESDNDLLRTIHNVAKIDPEFILQLAVYCREQLYLRSIPLMLIAEFANSNDCIGQTKVVSVTVPAGKTKVSIPHGMAGIPKIEKVIYPKILQSANVTADVSNITVSIDVAMDIDVTINVPCFRGVPGARKYVTRIIKRADELKEVMAYQLSRNKSVPRPSKDPKNKRQDKQIAIPNMIKYGLMNAFNKFDPYQFGKYNKLDQEVKLRDVMFMTHPRPLDDIQKETFGKITNNTLESPETWEVMRSTGRMNWHQVINDIFYKDNKIHNYMAILRNLRNCLTDDSVTKEDIMLLCRMISDRRAVLYSKQLPFRFFSAFRELTNMGSGGVPRRFGRFRSYSDESEPVRNLTNVGNLYLQSVLDSLEDAVLYGIENYPKLSGSSTCIACDVSGSMEKPISKNSSVERYDVGIMLGMMANHFAGHSITGFFGDDWKVIPMPKTGILRNTLEMHRREGEVGYSTNGYKVLTYLLENDIEVDRIMIFSDEQMWNSESDKTTLAKYFYLYQRKHPGVRLYGFDMAGYGTVMVPQNTRNFCVIGGWSDRVFDFVKIFEETGDGSVAVKKIKEIKP